MSTPVLLAIMGPTGAGKSFVAELLADKLSAQLINADAFQVYKSLDIGTNKPPPPTRSQYQLIDIVEPVEEFGVGDWIKRILPHLDANFAQAKNTIVVGGTGFYIRALFEQYAELNPPPDPKLRKQLEDDQNSNGLEALVEQLQQIAPEKAGQIDLKNPVRVRRALEIALTPREAISVQLPPFQKHKFALVPADLELKSAIHSRTQNFLQQGWIEEVENLLAQGIPKSAPGLRAIGYHNVIEYCSGNTDLQSLVELINNQTWQYVRRQKTWLRSEPQLQSFSDHSINESELEKITELILKKLQ